MKKDLKYLIPFWGLMALVDDAHYVVTELEGLESAGLIISSFCTTMLTVMGLMWLIFDVILK